MTLLVKKSDAFSAFLGFQQLIENKCNAKIVALRTDHGGEYESKVFNQHLQQCGIQHQYSAAYSHQQNSTSERYNRTVVESANTMLIAAQLEVHYWADAVAAAAFIKNRAPHSSIHSMTPYQAMFDRKPDLSVLRTFGCIAYPTIDESLRGTIAPHARECIMIGYANNHQAWKLALLTTGKLIISRDVRFVESTVLVNSSVPSIGTGVPVASTIMQQPEEKYDAGTLPYRPANQNVTLPIAISSSNVHNQELNEQPPTKKRCIKRMTKEEMINYDKRAAEQAEESLRTFIEQHHITSNTTKKQLITLTDGTKFDPASIKQYLKRCGEVARHCAAFVNTGCAAEAIKSVLADPVSHEEAMAHPDHVKWLQAEMDELDSIREAGTWLLVQLPAGRKAILCKWIYKTKQDAYGNVIKFKARLVAKGFTQRHGLDYDQTFAPVVRFSSIRLLLALAAYYDLEVEQLDVKTAYLNGELDEDIYMVQPPGYKVSGGEELVCHLQKALYGLKQSGRQWYIKIDSALLSMGFTRLVSDNCIYIKVTNEAKSIISLYVDDVLIFSTKQTALDLTKAQLKSHFKMTELGPVSFILGIKVDRNRPSRQLFISQPEYTKNLIAKFGLEHSKRSSNTPMSTGVTLTASTEAEGVSTKEYQAVIGSIMYLMLGTRPDIAFTISRLAQYCIKPSQQHWAAVKHLLRYLASTETLGILYQGPVSNSTDNNSTNQPPLLLGYCDADYANNIDDRRSITGFLFKIAEAAICWLSKRQHSIATSTVEAEYQSAAATAREAMSLRSTMRELTFNMNSPTIILCDNQGAIALTKSSQHHRQVKHIHVSHHFVRERVQERDIDVQYVSTDNMTADVLTKALPAATHKRHIEQMGITSFTPQI